ncbi:hypothetical protein G3570_06975 [Balneolaceae bacterium YR4-1]|uniref:Archaeal Type IV pilin N-terminal domain-containing protein n=1 Tax=Halalkalibaculum roseum TaxID=2709311 RepID=A0A6M1T0S4_9BACT|nr:hypothetical protein [Halalkalibaculum roseum]NGP76367.1 hypothetical protein [Halalkalibaculum roseum]
MGQQQLLLIILVTILVGIATVVAINVFTEAQEQSNQEAVILDMTSAVPDARAYFRKPTMLGGGGNSFANIGMDDLVLNASNENATYAISEPSQNSFKLTGTPTSGGDPIVLVVYEDSITWE